MIENVLLIIDPGHGGSESGACAFGYKEKDINLEISIELKLAAKEYFRNVIMTREADKYFNLSERGSWVASEAEKFLKGHPGGKVICFCEHNNAFNGQARGCEAIHSIHSDSELAQKITSKIVGLGIPLRRVFSRESTVTKGTDYYAMHRRTGKAQTIIIESIFVDNAQDIQFLKQPEFIPELARKHLEGLLDYLKISYAVPNPEPTIKPHWAQADHDELRALLRLEDHTGKLDQPATEGLVFNLINRMRKVGNPNE